jgi:hypothetical protein
MTINPPPSNRFIERSRSKGKEMEKQKLMRKKKTELAHGGAGSNGVARGCRLK